MTTTDNKLKEQIATLKASLIAAKENEQYANDRLWAYIEKDREHVAKLRQLMISLLDYPR